MTNQQQQQSHGIQQYEALSDEKMSNLPKHVQTFVKEKRARQKMLESGYTQSKRVMEICSISAFVALLVWNMYVSLRQWWQIGDGSLSYAGLSVPMFLFATVIGMTAADFISGLVHWMADTWGTIHWPLVGNTFIRSFREHHVDPTAITRHDWIQTNGDNFLVSFIFLVLPHIILAILPSSVFGSERGEAFFMLTVTIFAFFTSLTNQFHKWSHTYKPPAWVAWLQNNHVILSRQHHNYHHKMPFECCYCITTGWLNPMLDAVGFWRAVEAAVNLVTGWVARGDDMKWNDHVTALGKEQAFRLAEQEESELEKQAR